MHQILPRALRLFQPEKLVSESEHAVGLDLGGSQSGGLPLEKTHPELGVQLGRPRRVRGVARLLVPELDSAVQPAAADTLQLPEPLDPPFLQLRCLELRCVMQYVLSTKEEGKTFSAASTRAARWPAMTFLALRSLRRRSLSQRRRVRGSSVTIGGPMRASSSTLVSSASSMLTLPSAALQPEGTWRPKGQTCASN